MSKVRSLYDALIMYKKKEDQCTNFLLWLLQKLPSTVMLEICREASLSISRTDECPAVDAQFCLSDSIPDAKIEFLEGKHLLIETKREPGAFNEIQFMNHFLGGRKEFGRGNVWLLFLSGDSLIPEALDRLRKQFKGRIGFISWKSLLGLLKEYAGNNCEGYQILIKEFLVFAERYRLGRFEAMNTNELDEFLKVYPASLASQR